jgi:hypothetical protein
MLRELFPIECNHAHRPACGLPDLLDPFQLAQRRLVADVVDLSARCLACRSGDNRRSDVLDIAARATPARLLRVQQDRGPTGVHVA